MGACPAVEGREPGRIRRRPAPGPFLGDFRPDGVRPCARFGLAPVSCAPGGFQASGVFTH